MQDFEYVPTASILPGQHVWHGDREMVIESIGSPSTTGWVSIQFWHPSSQRSLTSRSWLHSKQTYSRPVQQRAR